MGKYRNALSKSQTNIGKQVFAPTFRIGNLVIKWIKLNIHSINEFIIFSALSWMMQLVEPIITKINFQKLTSILSITFAIRFHNNNNNRRCRNSFSMKLQLKLKSTFWLVCLCVCVCWALNAYSLHIKRNTFHPKTEISFTIFTSYQYQIGNDAIVILSVAPSTSDVSMSIWFSYDWIYFENGGRSIDFGFWVCIFFVAIPIERFCSPYRIFIYQQWVINDVICQAMVLK